MTAPTNEPITVNRDCEAILIPDGMAIEVPEGSVKTPGQRVAILDYEVSDQSNGEWVTSRTNNCCSAAYCAIVSGNISGSH